MNNLAVPSESIILFLELIEDLHDEEIVPGCCAAATAGWRNDSSVLNKMACRH
jgi:hypothetical protein